MNIMIRKTLCGKSLPRVALQVSFTLLAFAAVLSRRREDATALLVVEEMAQTPFAHPSFVRFLGGRGKLCNPLRVDIIEGRRWLFIWTVDASTLRAGEAL